MADRGLTAGDITALGGASVEFYHIISIGFSTPLYYTTAPFDIFHDANTYLSNATLVKLPDIKETLKISPNTISIELNGANASIVPILLSEGKNAEVIIKRRIESTGSVIALFQGYTDEFSISESAQEGKVNIRLKVANHWADWESVNGRILSDSYQQELYAGDVGLEFAPLVELFTDYWGNSLVNERVIYDPSYTFYTPGFYYNPNTQSQPVANLYDYWQPIINEAYNNETESKKLPVVYGQATIQGIPVFRTVVNDATTGVNNIMWVVYALAEGECNSLVDVKFNDISYTAAPYSTNVSVYFQAGTTTQTVLTALDTESVLWTTNHRLRGICYVAIRYTYDKDVWSEDPQPVFTIQGKKLYDPRDTTTTYNTNPALVLYDYLTSTVYGKGLASTLLDGINAAATYAETLKTDHDGGLGGTPVNIELLDFVGVINTYESMKTNVERILFTLRAYLPWIAGKYVVVQETETDTGTYVFNDDTIAGEITVKESSIRALANEIHYSFIDVAQANARTSVTVKSATFLTADNNRVLRKSITNLNETNRYRAENRANTELKRTRENISVSLSAANANALQIETGDIVNVTRSVYGWTAKKFRVFGMTLKLDGNVDLDLIEYEGTVFNWAVSAETDPPADTSIDNAFFIDPPTGLTMESGTDVLLLEGDGTVVSRIKVSWTAPTTDTKVAGYHVYSKLSTDTNYQFPTVIPDDTMTTTFITPVQDGLAYDIKVHTLSMLGNESTALTGQHTVIGKTAPPEDVQGFFVSQNGEVVVLRWTQVTDVDLAGYLIKYGDAGASCCWNAALPLTEVTRGTNITTADIPPGTWIVFIKAVDTSGNESVNAAQQVIEVTTDKDFIYRIPQSKLWYGLFHPDNVAKAPLTEWRTDATVTTSVSTTPNASEMQAYTLNDNSTTATMDVIYTEYDSYAHGGTWTAATLVKKDAAATADLGIFLRFKFGAQSSYVYGNYDPTDSSFATGDAGTAATLEASGVVSVDDDWDFIYLTGHSTTINTTAVEIILRPAYGGYALTQTQIVCNPVLVADPLYSTPRRSAITTNPDNVFSAAQNLTTWTTTGSPTVASSASTSPDQYSTAYDITDNSATLFEYISNTSTTGYVNGDPWTAAIYIEEHATNTDLAGIRLQFTGGTGSSNLEIRINRTSGVPQTASTNATILKSGSIKAGTWYFVFIVGYTTLTDTTGIQMDIFPKMGVGTQTGAATVSDATCVPGFWDNPHVANMVKTHTGVMAPKSKTLASANGWDVFDLYVVDPYDEGKYEAIEIDVGFDQTGRCFAWTSNAMGPGEIQTFAGVDMYFDYRLAAGSYDGMELWSIDTVGLRYGRFQFIVDFSLGLPVITELEPTIDTVEHEEEGVNVTVAVGGTTITFATPFNTTPYISTQVVATSLLQSVISSPSTTGFTVQVFDKSGAGASGTDVGGTINWEARGI